MASVASDNAPRSRLAITNAWVIALGMALLAIPTIITLGEQVWSKESGAHGPIVLVTGLWLLWRQRDEMLADAAPGSDWLTVPAMAASLALYIFGRAYDFISLEVIGLYGVGVCLLYACFGWRVLLNNWFPLFYLGFLVPPPGWFMDSITAPLKLFVSYAATEGLQAIGIPVFREGVTLIIGHYQLLVEDACSGMNSITGLVAISLFYIYLLRKASWGYSMVLVALVIPIAIVANIIRIVALVLLTYFFGDAVAQGFLHMAAGIFLFVTALLLVFAVDSLMSRMIIRKEATA